jgi:hypothetical protein
MLVRRLVQMVEESSMRLCLSGNVRCFGGGGGFVEAGDAVAGAGSAEPRLGMLR